MSDNLHDYTLDVHRGNYVQIIEEIDLVTFYADYLEEVRKHGFRLLILALIRDADAPSFYEDLKRYWSSLNDVTGNYALFAVAGTGASQTLRATPIARRSGWTGFSSEMASPSGENPARLKEKADLLRRNPNSSNSLLGADSTGARLERIAESNTSNVGKLTRHLGLREMDVPRLHLTLLIPNGTETAILPTSMLGDFSIYLLCKDIIHSLQASFDAWAAAEKRDAGRGFLQKKREPRTAQTDQTLAEVRLEFKRLDSGWQNSIATNRWDYFISYAAADREIAIRLFRSLDNVGKTFLDHFCLNPGQDWQAKIPMAQANSRSTVAIISPNTKDAHFQISEIQRAINQHRRGNHRLVPVYVSNAVATPFGLEQVHSIFPSDDPSGDAVAAALSFLQSDIAKPPSGNEPA